MRKSTIWFSIRIWNLKLSLSKRMLCLDKIFQRFTPIRNLLFHQIRWVFHEI